MKRIVAISSIFFMNSYSTEKLIEVSMVIPTAVLDIKYATEDNFTKLKIYSNARCFLIEPVAYALKAVSDDLNKKGYRIKIWDGYRPLTVQKILWEKVALQYPTESEREHYVANPKKGSRHNRGCAVDLTLIDKEGKELDMGTGFDDFTTKAHRDYKWLSPRIIENRRILRDSMIKGGFKELPTEWWHFDYEGWQKYPLLDISLDDIK